MRSWRWSRPTRCARRVASPLISGCTADLFQISSTATRTAQVSGALQREVHHPRGVRHVLLICLELLACTFPQLNRHQATTQSHFLLIYFLSIHPSIHPFIRSFIHCFLCTRGDGKRRPNQKGRRSLSCIKSGPTAAYWPSASYR